jgi:hypothetical protein
MTRLLSSLATVVALCCAAAWAPLRTEAAAADGVIVVRGNKMYNEKTGVRFMIKGVRRENDLTKRVMRLGLLMRVCGVVW